MRILHVTGVYPTPEDPKPGIFIQTQVESLRAVGVEVDVCVLQGRGALKYVSGITQIRGFLAKKNYDLIHAHYMYAGWTARLAGAGPLVVSFMGNDVLGNCDAEGRYSPGSAWVHGFLSSLLARVSAHAVVKSPQLGRRIGVKSQSLVANGVDREIFKPMTPQREKYGYGPGEWVILFAGHPDDPVKRWPLAARAVAQLKVTVPGARLTFAEHKTPAQMAEIMASADCLLLTSAHEGSPNIVKEALACGLPVVSVPVGDVAERLAGLEGCYVTPPEAAALAQALASVAARRQRLVGSQARAESVQMVAEKLRAIYAQVAAGSL